MEFSECIHQFARRVSEQLPHIQTEEATKLVLINPFIREILGYDTANLNEVWPEYTADIGIKKGEKVDYAIMNDGEPTILIEAKKAGTPLESKEPSQLYRYFAATGPAKFGIYTDGVQYLFYSDLDKNNLMDKRPFLRLNLLEIDTVAVTEVAKFVKPNFNPEVIRASANELKYTQSIKSALLAEFKEPSEELVRLLMIRIYTGVRTQQRVAQFSTFTRDALRQVIDDEVRNRLNAALVRSGEERSDSMETGHGLGGATEQSNRTEEGDRITEDENQGYYIVKSLLHHIIDPNRIYLRGMKRRSTVLVDDTIRKPICHFDFRKAKKSLFYFNEQKEKVRVFIDTLNDIYQYTDNLLATARLYIQTEEAENAEEINK